MISFIIIGRNEGWKLEKCLQSVFQTIKYNGLNQKDVIYVDSKSTDNSIDIARSFNEISIFEIVGECNAAIARNIGAKEAKGDILFFIDGDMELVPSFLSHALNNLIKLTSNCITGHLNDYFYTPQGEFIEVNKRTYQKELPESEETIHLNGGVFLIRRENWEKVNGMKTKYRRSQDLDLFLRLSKKDIRTIRLPHLIVKHHTVDYRNDNRMWNDLKKGNILYDSLIIREHFISMDCLKRTIRSKYTSFLFFPVFSGFVLNLKILIILLPIYLVTVITRVATNTKKTWTKGNKIIYFIKRLIYQFIIDILFWIGIISFYPTEKEINYRKA